MSKKKREAKKHFEALEKVKDLWLNYQSRYFSYKIYYRNPITGMVEIFNFPYLITREKQQTAFKENNWDWTHLALRKAYNFLNSKDMAYWVGGEARKGIIIREALDVKFGEIKKAEYDKLQAE